MSDEVLDWVNQLLQPKRLSYIQELVFLQSWAGKFYREIASESGYDLDYIKEVGSQLWILLSESLGEKVTKKNVKVVLSQTLRSRVLSDAEVVHRTALEFPSGALPLTSKLYVQRPLIEEKVYTELTRPGCFIRIKASHQMGKTSLMLRALAQARTQGYHTILVNIHQADSQVFTSLSTFLRWLCLYISRQLNLDPRLDDFWDDEVGSKVSCTGYVQDYVLSHLQQPLVLALDEVNRVFTHTALAQDFLPLLRVWHEEAAERPIWQQLRLIIAHSTDVYVPLKLSQSPFNVGLPVQLPDFTTDQAYELARRCGLMPHELEPQDLQQLLQLIHGHPYLLHLAFYWLRQGDISLSRLIEEAPTQSGIYSHHLRQYWQILQHQPELMESFGHVVNSTQPVQLDAIAAYQLESMGLVKLSGNMASLSCQLYRLYFSAQFQKSAQQ